MNLQNQTSDIFEHIKKQAKPFLVRLVALRGFLNNCEIKVQGSSHPRAVNKGLCWTEDVSDPERLRTVLLLNRADCVGDGNDKALVKMVQDEVAIETAKAERTAKAYEATQRRLGIIA